jgi:hypothetical protein
MLNLEEEILKDRLFYLNNEINQKELISDKEKTQKLLQDYQKIVEKNRRD